MKSFKSFAVASAFFLTAGMALGGAPQKNAAGTPQVKSQPAEKNNRSQPSSHGKLFEQRGTVSEMTGTQLVLLHEVSGQEKSMRFQINTKTKRQGAIGTGTPVTVHYKSAGRDEPIATTASERRCSCWRTWRGGGIRSISGKDSTRRAGQAPAAKAQI